jgi:hypothetical protein
MNIPLTRNDICPQNEFTLKMERNMPSRCKDDCALKVDQKMENMYVST